jgi:hypothetical protein
VSDCNSTRTPQRGFVNGKWHENQTEVLLPDGGVELISQLAPLSEVLEWILAGVNHVRVYEPQELIDRLIERLRKTLALCGLPAEGDSSAP